MIDIEKEKLYFSGLGKKVSVTTIDGKVHEGEMEVYETEYDSGYGVPCIWVDEIITTDKITSFEIIE